MNRDLKRLYDEDQRDRDTTNSRHLDLKDLYWRDQERRQTAREILGNGGCVEGVDTFTLR